MDLKNKKIKIAFFMLSLALPFYLVFAQAELSPSPDAVAPPNPSPSPAISLSPEDALLYITTPKLTINQKSIIYSTPNKTIFLSAMLSNVPKNSVVNWYVNNKLFATGRNASFLVGAKVPTEYLIRAETLLEGFIYDIKNIHQVSTDTVVKVVDVDLYFYAKNSSFDLRKKTIPPPDSEARVVAIPFTRNETFYYEWSINGNVQKSFSGFNKNFVEIRGNSYPSIKTVSLKLRSLGGEIILIKEIDVPFRN